MNKCAEGIYIVGRYGNPLCATWLFENNGECAIVEMPPFFKRKGRPIEIIKETIHKKGLKGPKYILSSHAHIDHTYSIFHYKKAFPGAKLIGHSSFLNDYFIKSFFYMYWTKNKRIYGQDIANKMGLFDEVFTTDLYQLILGKEPLYLIYAPKHSYEDIMIVFKGAMITGDWAIGPYPDCNDIVSSHDKIQSIDKLIYILREKNYKVHMLFSAHGDNLIYNVDFEAVMKETRDFCARINNTHHDYQW
ncbi:MAG: hypothetical protein BWY64_02245 [bacterium ADurb.Bin363]|nr:MAG: hypothetical protein BWY64_02245 [bacterium ADurb.Bin363]